MASAWWRDPKGVDGLEKTTKDLGGILIVLLLGGWTLAACSPSEDGAPVPTDVVESADEPLATTTLDEDKQEESDEGAEGDEDPDEGEPEGQGEVREGGYAEGQEKAPEEGEQGLPDEDDGAGGEG
jgi:hypothetical protein